MKYLLFCLILAGCAGWNPAKVGYVDTLTGCPRDLHTVRGPDAYDVAHGRPYHCEAPLYDPIYNDIDQVDR